MPHCTLFAPRMSIVDLFPRRKAAWSPLPATERLSPAHAEERTDNERDCRHLQAEIDHGMQDRNQRNGEGGARQVTMRPSPGQSAIEGYAPRDQDNGIAEQGHRHPDLDHR